MARGHHKPKGDKFSTKYRCYLLEGTFFEPVDSNRENYVYVSTEDKKRNNKNSEPKPEEIMTTRELISAVGTLWNSAAHPLSLFLSSATSADRNIDRHKNSTIYASPVMGIQNVPPLADGGIIPAHLSSDKDSSLLVSTNLESLSADENLPFTETCNESFCLRRLIHHVLDMRHKSRRGICPGNQIISNNLENAYGWMNGVAFSNSNLFSSWIKNCKFHDCFLGKVASRNGICCTDVKSSSQLSVYNSNLHKNVGAFNSTSCLKHDNAVSNGIEPNSSQTSGSRAHVYSSEELINPAFSASVETNRSESGLDENGPNQNITSESENAVVAKKNRCHSLAKQEHAFAGAMAGICVSICLHPMDTIKTVTQTCHADQRPLYYVARSVISERGLMGLYRGIYSNIASSAPISALYTFTYELVKGALLPLLNTEHQFVAHCIAGGSASVATSFIYTPSERIKQQMQVHSQYKSCWNASICIIKNGGLPSLYAGWGAVLCRNVPHSIIKFYTYESLKQLVSSPVKFDLQNNTLVTLVCGGLSGSTAALFTTPFDVVKTRFQTQVPGSNQYGGVLDTLTKIAKHEGLKGLYRGLTPRLIMYITQGALFFASYESFKRLFSIDVHKLTALRT
ncbi:unnamed protein product [Cuscuta campestris]|uniref:Uncharacterized protein n=1 Tax=Cuscuta campestris TaxID=132261 RepID=A0A484LFX0_9ASTE|nr:unnamed protein product [Cuscuta campestris]